MSSNPRINMPTANNMRAASAGCASGRENYAHQGMGCAIAPPPPKRQYCTPAPFSSVYGMNRFFVTEAYGQSRPIVD